MGGEVETESERREKSEKREGESRMREKKETVRVEGRGVRQWEKRGRDSERSEMRERAE